MVLGGAAGCAVAACALFPACICPPIGAGGHLPFLNTGSKAGVAHADLPIARGTKKARLQAPLARSTAAADSAGSRATIAPPLWLASITEVGQKGCLEGAPRPFLGYGVQREAGAPFLRGLVLRCPRNGQRKPIPDASARLRTAATAPRFGAREGRGLAVRFST